MGYFTNYRIIDTKNDSVVFRNTRTACFSEFSNIYRDLKPELEYNSDYKMQIFYPIGSLKISKDDEKWYLSQLNKRLGIKVRRYEVKLSREDINTSYPEKMQTGLNRMWTLMYKNYKSKAQIKLVAHMIRTLYEENAYRIIPIARKYMNENSECSLLEALAISWTYFISTSPMDMGHGIFYSPGVINQFIKDNELLNYFKTWESAEYNNTEFNKIWQDFRIERFLTHPNYINYTKLTYNYAKNTYKADIIESYSNYLKAIEHIKKEHGG